MHFVRDRSQHGPVMFHVTLICTDEGCAEEFEDWVELEALDAMLCEGCDCVLLALDFSEIPAAGVPACPAGRGVPGCVTRPSLTVHGTDDFGCRRRSDQSEPDPPGPAC